MKIQVVLIAVFACMTFGFSQSLPLSKLPEPPKAYSAGTVAARMVEGLGFRFYWATEGLRESDLAFVPSEGARTSRETIDHIYGLVSIIYNAVLEKPNADEDQESLTFNELRSTILIRLSETASILRMSSDKQMKKYDLVFGEEENVTRYPFWYNLHGPIADALWHTGQIVSFRRSSGNPFNPNVSVFNGSVRE